MIRKRAYVSLIGGFGNNLFQIAAAASLEKIGYKVKFDLSNAKKFELELLKIPDLSDFVKDRIAWFTILLPSPIGRNAFVGRSLIQKLLGYSLIIDLNSNGVVPDTSRKSIFVTGYWQNLISAYMFPKFSFFERPIKNGKIAIHVRRGDMKVNVEKPMDDYFRKCIKIILSRNPQNSFQVFVYTDDPMYCRNTLDLGVRFTLIEESSAIDDFIGMVESEYIIISRSTFSWWAAFVSKGYVFCPDPWDRDKPGIEDSVFPNKWERVACN